MLSVHSGVKGQLEVDSQLTTREIESFLKQAMGKESGEEQFCNLKTGLFFRHRKFSKSLTHVHRDSRPGRMALVLVEFDLTLPAAGTARRNLMIPVPVQ